VLSASSPQVIVIDAQSQKVIRTKDVLGSDTSWSWNDTENYYDGRDLWLTTLNSKTQDAEVITLNLDSLEITHHIALGKEPVTLYMGRPSKDGRLLVAKGGDWQIAVIDTKTYRVVQTVDEPVNAPSSSAHNAPGASTLYEVCDIDVSTPPDGVERAFYPTWAGHTVVSVNARTLQPLKTRDFGGGAQPWMLTVAPDGRLWVQDASSNANDVLDPETLAVVKSIPTGKAPVEVAFSPDGRYGYVSGVDPSISVVDTRSLEVAHTIDVGTSPQEVVADPNGKFVYAVVTQEHSVAVISTSSWTVIGHIELGTNPSYLFLRTTS